MALTDICRPYSQKFSAFLAVSFLRLSCLVSLYKNTKKFCTNRIVCRNSSILMQIDRIFCCFLTILCYTEYTAHKMGNARRSSSAAPSQQERCFMNSITTRVWIAGASGRLGSALSHRFGGNTAYKLVTSDRDVAVEDVSVVGRFADINQSGCHHQLCRSDRRAGLRGEPLKKRIRSTPSAPAIWRPLQDASTQNSFRSRPTTYSAATRTRLSVSSTIPIRPRCTARASTPVKSSCVS